MEDLLKYVSLIALCGTAVSFVIGLLKWIDHRNREQEQQQYGAFHKKVCIASGFDETGKKKVAMVQQIAAVYQLQVYQQYSFASIPVLELMQEEFADSGDPRSGHMEKSLRETIAVLSKHRHRGHAK